VDLIRIYDNGLINKLYKKYDINKILDIDLSKDLILLKFDKNEIVCGEGDVVNYLYLMVEGKLKVNINHENGKTLMLKFLDGFEVLGDIELIAETNYSSTAIAVTDVYCFSLDLNTYKDKLLNNNTFLRYTAKTLAKHLLINNEISSFNLLYPLETRVATYILLSVKDGKLPSHNLSVLAELFATSYRHLSRVLAKFCELGIIEKRINYYQVVNVEKLKEYSNTTITYL
jgi:CRP-like cAMP-binding protein